MQQRTVKSRYGCHLEMYDFFAAQRVRSLLLLGFFQSQLGSSLKNRIFQKGSYFVEYRYALKTTNPVLRVTRFAVDDAVSSRSRFVCNRKSATVTTGTISSSKAETDLATSWPRCASTCFWSSHGVCRSSLSSPCGTATTKLCTVHGISAGRAFAAVSAAAHSGFGADCAPVHSITVSAGAPTATGFFCFVFCWVCHRTVTVSA
jgi:hypothetical protein